MSIREYDQLRALYRRAYPTGMPLARALQIKTAVDMPYAELVIEKGHASWRIKDMVMFGSFPVLTYKNTYAMLLNEMCEELVSEVKDIRNFIYYALAYDSVMYSVTETLYIKHVVYENKSTFEERKDHSTRMEKKLHDEHKKHWHKENYSRFFRDSDDDRMYHFMRLAKDLKVKFSTLYKDFEIPKVRRITTILEEMTTYITETGGYLLAMMSREELAKKYNKLGTLLEDYGITGFFSRLKEVLLGGFKAFKDFVYEIWETIKSTLGQIPYFSDYAPSILQPNEIAVAPVDELVLEADDILHNMQPRPNNDILEVDNIEDLDIPELHQVPARDGAIVLEHQVAPQITEVRMERIPVEEFKAPSFEEVYDRPEVPKNKPFTFEVKNNTDSHLLSKPRKIGFSLKAEKHMPRSNQWSKPKEQESTKQKGKNKNKNGKKDINAYTVREPMDIFGDDGESPEPDGGEASLMKLPTSKDANNVELKYEDTGDSNKSEEVCKDPSKEEIKNGEDEQEEIVMTVNMTGEVRGTDNLGIETMTSQEIIVGQGSKEVTIRVPTCPKPNLNKPIYLRIPDPKTHKSFVPELRVIDGMYIFETLNGFCFPHS